MKKIIICIIALFCLASATWAADNFYYYRGDKLPLDVNANRIVSIAQKSEDATLSPSKGFTLVNTIADQRCLIKVYELHSSTTLQKALSSDLLPVTISLQPCYQTEDGKDIIPDGYINVKLKSASDYAILQSVAQQFNCEIIEQNPFMPLWYTLKMTAGINRNSIDIANDIYETGKFAAAEPSLSLDGEEISYDPFVKYQWGLYNAEYPDYDISISQAWNYATGRGIKIAIVDKGIDLQHQDLAANIYSMSYDTGTNSSPSKIYGPHGTHCAGIAAAVRNNGIYVAGVAPDATLMSISNSLGAGPIYAMTLANGINWAWKNGADVISCSWTCAESNLLDDAIDAAVTKGRDGKGCVFVNSAGNTSGAISHPGDYGPDVLAIANMTKDGSLDAESAHGANMFVAAPGKDIYSTMPDNQIAKMSGTSMACPHVAGVAALVLERNPRLTAAKVREIIAKNAKKIGNRAYNITKTYGSWNEYYGYGLVDAYNAVLNTPR